MSEQIRILGITIHKSSNGLYSLTDLFKASGAKLADRPANWFRTNEFIKEKMFLESVIGSSQKIVAEQNQGVMTDMPVTHKRVTEQNQRVIEVIQGGNPELQGTYVCEDLVYSYAMWVSAEFKFAVIRAFDHLANDRILEAQTIANTAINHIIKKREPNGIQTLAVIIGCTVFESRYYYEVLVGKGLLTKKVNKNGQAKYYPVGNQNWFEGYKRTTMLFNSAVLDVLPIQEDLADL